MDEVTKIFLADVKGKTRQVMITLPAKYADDPEMAWAIIVGDDHYWDVFWGNESHVNDPATGDEWVAMVNNRRLTKVVAG